MSKIGKQQAINLFKFVSRVDVKFNPWGGDANVQAREFLRQMRSKAHAKANPKCAVVPTLVLDKPIWPTIEMKFVDGSELKWQANTEKVAIMIEVYRRHCLDIELQWALEGKDIDDGLS